MSQARVDNIGARARRAAPPLGRITAMRRGDLRWRLTVERDGTMHEGGLLPFLIEWETARHPAAAMPLDLKREGLARFVELLPVRQERGEIRPNLRTLEPAATLFGSARRVKR